MNDEQLKQQLHQSFAEQEQKAPDFYRTLEESKIRLVQQKANQPYRYYYWPVAAAVFAGIALFSLQWLQSKPEQLPDYVTAEELSIRIWNPPSDVLLPPYPINLYDKVPTFINSMPSSPGELL